MKVSFASLEQVKKNIANYWKYKEVQLLKEKRKVERQLKRKK